jgi:hypothetical protein
VSTLSFVLKQFLHTSLNPLPLIFKALLQGRKTTFFFSGHLIYILQQERCGALGMAKG